MTNLEKFKIFWLSQSTLEALEKKWFEEPSPIQTETIPLLLKWELDIIWQAQTWTGKTAAFGIPLIEVLKPKQWHIQAIIVTPTRELCIQVAEEINSLQSGKDRLSIIPIYWWQSYTQQIRALKRGIDIVVGTPGRVIDHIKRKTLKLDKISNMILDEADEMLNMWFEEDIKTIFEQTNKDKRVLLFSATMPSAIKKVAEKYMKWYKHIKIESEQMTTEQTDQIYFEVKDRDKFEALSRIIDMETDFYGIIFCRTKVDVDFIVNRLTERWYIAEALHWDIQQSSREKILKRFKDKKTNILVATDVAARWIDVNDVSHVINYALPGDPESYVHRIGRTWRAGKKGIAITLITPSEYGRLSFFKKITKTNIKKWTIPNASDIISSKKQKLINDIESSINNDEYKEQLALANEIIWDKDPVEILASLLKITYSNELNISKYKEIWSSSINRAWTTRLFIALWRKHWFTPKGMIDHICNIANVRSNIIDDLCLLEDFSFINVPFEEAESIIKMFDKERVSWSKPIVTKAKDKWRSGGNHHKGWDRGRSGWFRPREKSWNWRSSWGYRPRSEGQRKPRKK